MSDDIKFMTPRESFVFIKVMNGQEISSILLNLTAVAYIRANTITLISGEVLTAIQGNETFEEYIMNLANFCGSNT